MNTHIPPGDNGTKLMNAGILRTYEDRRDATRSAGGLFPLSNGTAHALPFSKSFSLAISSFFFLRKIFLPRLDVPTNQGSSRHLSTIVSLLIINCVR